MSTGTPLTVGEIVGATLNVPLPQNNDSTFENVIQALQVGKFKTTSTYTAEFSKYVNDLLSKLTFSGQGFAFGILTTKLAAQFLRGMEFVDPALNPQTMDKDPSQIFTNTNLEQISSDFNYILGLVLGKLNMDSSRYECNFEIHLSKKISDVHSLDHLLMPESKTFFDKATNFKLNGIHTSMVEKLFEVEVLSKYQIYEAHETHDKGSYNANAKFYFNHSGPINFYELIYQSIHRLNDLTVRIVGDIDE